jgi:hypothetical protein
MVLNKSIEVKIFGVSMMGTSEVGCSIIPIKKGIYVLDKEFTISGKLFDKSNTALGRIVISSELRTVKDADLTSTNYSFKTAVLQIIRLRTFELKNTEIYGLQDPYLIIRSGKTFQEKTKNFSE